MHRTILQHFRLASQNWCSKIYTCASFPEYGKLKAILWLFQPYIGTSCSSRSLLRLGGLVYNSHATFIHTFELFYRYVQVSSPCFHSPWSELKQLKRGRGLNPWCLRGFLKTLLNCIIIVIHNKNNNSPTLHHGKSLSTRPV